MVSYYLWRLQFNFNSSFLYPRLVNSNSFCETSLKIHLLHAKNNRRQLILENFWEILDVLHFCSICKWHKNSHSLNVNVLWPVQTRHLHLFQDANLKIEEHEHIHNAHCLRSPIWIKKNFCGRDCISSQIYAKTN